METNVTKDILINKFLKLVDRDYHNLNRIIHIFNTYISENEYDVQLELVLHAFRAFRETDISDDYDKICEVAAPIFKLLKTVDWGIVELHVLASVICFTPHYSTSQQLIKEAYVVLDDKFHDHKEYKRIELNLNGNMLIRLLRAKYYDGENIEDINPLFDQSVKTAIALLDKSGYTTLKSTLVIRKALFDGDCEKLSKQLDLLESTNDKTRIKYIQEEVIEFLHHLGDKITTPLLNFLIGYRIKKRRKELGITTIDFADAIGSNQTLINGIERGDKGVGGPRLLKMAKVLDVEISYFYGDMKKPPNRVITDITSHKLMQLVAPLSEDDKEYILEFTRGFIQHKKKTAQPKKKIQKSTES